MKVLIIQNNVFETVNENIHHIKSMIHDTPTTSIDFIVFPEMFTTPYEMTYFKSNQQTKNGLVINFLSDLAKKHHAYVIGGSIPESSNNHLYNTTFVFDREGEIITKYRKMYLFEVTYPNGETFRESDTLTAGHQPVTFGTEYGKIGLMICFDIRFPLLARTLQKEGAKVIFVPAAFNTYTGPLHWHTTFKARAIDNQLFMVGASPSRNSFGDYHPYGHSLVVDPLGKIIKELNEKEGYLIVDIHLEDIENARQTIPIVKNDIR